MVPPVNVRVGLADTVIKRNGREPVVPEGRHATSGDSGCQLVELFVNCGLGGAPAGRVKRAPTFAPPGICPSEHLRGYKRTRLVISRRCPRKRALSPNRCATCSRRQFDRTQW